MSQLPDLRDYVRSDPSLRSEVIVARGGPDTVDKLRMHAERLRRAFVLDRNEALGISVYAALDDVGPASLDAILGSKLGSYRWVHLVSVADLRAGAFELLATFDRPHFTLLLPDADAIDQLLDTLGAAQPNARYGRGGNRGRRRPR